MTVETLGDALHARWRVKVRCAWGNRAGLKTIRECLCAAELDLETLVWTRGRALPITELENRLLCPRCGSKTVQVTWFGTDGNLILREE